MVIHILSIMTVVPFLVKVVKMIDVHLAIIGFTVIFFVNMLRGSWLNEIGEFCLGVFSNCNFLFKTKLN